MPTESLTLEVPTHLDRADRPLFGRTTRELLVLTGGLFTALGTVQQAHVALGLRLGEGLLVAVAGRRPGGPARLVSSCRALPGHLGPRGSGPCHGAPHPGLERPQDPPSGRWGATPTTSGTKRVAGLRRPGSLAGSGHPLPARPASDPGAAP